MVGSCDRLDPKSGCPACSTCGYRTDPDFTAANFKLKQKRYDISCCYDGAVIVSIRFREFCTSTGTSGLAFVPLLGIPGFFHLKCNSPVRLDYQAMETEHGRYCSSCGQYRDFVGYSRVVLQSSTALPATGLAFSDRYFGSNNEAIPLLIAGDSFTAAAKATRISGIARYSRIDA
jgi:hypothetical protein